MAKRSHIPADVIERVRLAANDRCGYCLAARKWIGAPMEIDHLHPVAHGGSDDESNLWLACPICNGHKWQKTTGVDPETGQRHPLFKPRTERWRDHFRWSEDGLRVVGLTPTGRATVSALHLDRDPTALMARESWITVGRHPPPDDD